jgi:hypothetical protein
VRDQGVEIPVAQDRHHHFHIPGGQSDCLGQSFFFHAEQFRDRSVGAGNLGQ